MVRRRQSVVRIQQRIHFGVFVFSVVLALFVVSVILNGRVSAAYVPGASMPTNLAEAQQRLTWMCNQTEKGRTGGTVKVAEAHAAWPSNVKLVQNTGEISYTLNIIWKGCPGGPASTAYAITGYPLKTSDGSLAVCPNVGNYASDATYDCVKYIGDPEFVNKFNKPVDGDFPLVCNGKTQNANCIWPEYRSSRGADNLTSNVIFRRAL